MTERLAVRTENLSRLYKFRPTKGSKETKTLVALDDVNLEIRQGELFGLLGPNGAGKTTLIKILTTLLSPTTGRAWVDGLDVEERPGKVRRRINMISGGESSGYGLLTVRENLWMFAQFYGLDYRTTNRRIDELLAVVGLSDRANTKISDLSTGLRQKMNFVRGFVTDPRIIFLDEPTLGLDVGAAREARGYISRWVGDARDKTVLLTTHYMIEADELCDRVAIIDQGRVLACDTPAALKRRLQREPIFHLKTTHLPKGVERLKGLDGVRQLNHTHQNGHTELDLMLAGDDVLPAVMAAITESQARVLSLEKREPTLEDVFVDLVGRGLSQDTSQRGGEG